MRVRLGLDGAGRVVVATGAGLYDHLLEQLAFHAGFDLVLDGVGDLETGEHHTAEDAALALGEALDACARRPSRNRALRRRSRPDGRRPRAGRRGSRRPAGGRASARARSRARASTCCGASSQAGRLAINVEAGGRDDHHVAEAAFKAVGRALRAAVRVESSGVPSTKGVV